MGLSGYELWLLALVALIVGFSKAGIQGATMPAVAILAVMFGGKASAGIMLPMLIVGDIAAVYQYGKAANFRDVLKLMPASVIGIILGALTGNYLDDQQFKFIMGIIVLICLALLVFRQFQKQAVELPKRPWLTQLVGVTSGFSSMVGNAAGPIFNVYILAQNLNKNAMIGTTAWFFLIINLIKVPFHVFLWGTITWDTLKYTLFAIPFIGIGALIGIWLIKRINENPYKYLIIILTAISAVRLMI
ncbi:sulfite exporter TauE/SafE family protein [Fundicoccus culcitae]|uniref:Probable membrane transporter protein n=1 Tax=Fundicoccus culcitae TaxID=2969821 RepID=A0ABY5P828_9LACT|nr:sulfite exporter TauE/SafE family protein [Fundicoccus culcitae]UUX34679.1 sulfite exporter TauE/SafE family protein [Fundicoccus culcitae]